MSNNELQSILLKVSQTADFYGKQVIDVNSKGMFGTTPLHLAVTWGDLAAGKILLSAGADANACGEYGYTPLHEAVDQGSIAFVELLLAHGASPINKNQEGLSVLEFANSLKEVEISRLLAKNIES